MVRLSVTREKTLVLLPIRIGSIKMAQEQWLVTPKVVVAKSGLGINGMIG